MKLRNKSNFSKPTVIWEASYGGPAHEIITVQGGWYKMDYTSFDGNGAWIEEQIPESCYVNGEIDVQKLLKHIRTKS